MTVIRQAVPDKQNRRPSDGWTRSARRDVWIRPDSDGRIRAMSDYSLERDLEPADIMTLAEAAAFLRKSTQTLLNWRKKYPAFPIEKWGGQWVVIRPYLEAFLLHGSA